MTYFLGKWKFSARDQSHTKNKTKQTNKQKTTQASGS